MDPFGVVVARHTPIYTYINTYTYVERDRDNIYIYIPVYIFREKKLCGPLLALQWPHINICIHMCIYMYIYIYTHATTVTPKVVNINLSQLLFNVCERKCNKAIGVLKESFGKSFT